MKKVLTVFITLFALTGLLITPISAQSWFQYGRVLGANDSVAQQPESVNELRGSDGAAASQGEVMQNQEGEGRGLRNNADFQELVEQRRLSAQERQEKARELRETVLSERCEIVKENLQRRSDYYQNSYLLHVGRYQEIAASLENLVTRLQDAGYNTAEVQTLLDSLNVKIRELGAIQDELVSTITNTRLGLCQNFSFGESTYESSLEDIRSSLAALREQVVEIQTLLSQEIVVALRQLVSTGGQQDGEGIQDDSDEIRETDEPLNS